MVDYWLDADIFISSKNGSYGFDIAPGFWAFIEQKATEGIIATSTLVYDELVTEADDELAQWAKQRKDIGLFVTPDESVQRSFQRVADHVNSSYAAPEAALFLRGADPWLISHALTHGGQVVTFEVKKGIGAKRVKIPNVCDHFGIPRENLYQVLRMLGLRLR